MRANKESQQILIETTLCQCKDGSQKRRKEESKSRDRHQPDGGDGLGWLAASCLKSEAWLALPCSAKAFGNYQQCLCCESGTPVRMDGDCGFVGPKNKTNNHGPVRIWDALVIGTVCNVKRILSLYWIIRGIMCIMTISVSTSTFGQRWAE